MPFQNIQPTTRTTTTNNMPFSSPSMLKGTDVFEEHGVKVQVNYTAIGLSECYRVLSTMPAL